MATYDRPHYAARCITSVLANRYKAFEVIVVDQSPNQDTQREIAKRATDDPRVHYVHSDVVGVSHARNLGVALAKGEIIALIDDDAVATPNWIEAYARAYQEIKPPPGIIGGKIDPLWEVPRPAWYPAERQFLLGIYDIGDELRPFPVGDLPISANFAVLKAVMESIGGFDTRVGFNNRHSHRLMTGEDSLFALKIQELGYSIYYQPEARVLHSVRASKLRKRSFLNRHFWEGATMVAIRDLQNPGQSATLLGNIRWHGMRVPHKFFLLLRAMMLAQGKRDQELMLRLAELTLTAGVVYWSSRLLVQYWSGRDGRP